MINDVSVHKTITVNAGLERAFRVFCEQMTGWWPHDYHIAEQPVDAIVLEPRNDGRWYEQAADGTQCDWGRVIEFEPPQRLVLAWQISPNWTFDPTVASEVHVQFIAEDADRTRIELEHRNLDTFGESSETMRTIFDGEGGWTAILGRYASVINS